MGDHVSSLFSAMKNLNFSITIDPCYHLSHCHKLSYGVPGDRLLPPSSFFCACILLSFLSHFFHTNTSHIVICTLSLHVIFLFVLFLNLHPPFFYSLSQYLPFLFSILLPFFLSFCYFLWCSLFFSHLWSA